MKTEFKNNNCVYYISLVICLLATMITMLTSMSWKQCNPWGPFIVGVVTFLLLVFVMLVYRTGYKHGQINFSLGRVDWKLQNTATGEVKWKKVEVEVEPEYEDED